MVRPRGRGMVASGRHARECFRYVFVVAAGVVDLRIGSCCGRSRLRRPYRCEKWRPRRAEKQRKRRLDVSTCFIFSARSSCAVFGVLMRKFD